MAIDFANGQFSPKALDFLTHSTARLCILHGSVRSSKTVNCTVRWLKYIKDGPPGDLVMMGKDRGAIWRNVLNDMLDLVGKKNFRWVDRTRGELEVFGRRIWIMGASTVETEERLRGSTFAGAYCDEANTYPETVWNQLMARLSIKGAQVFANCNPEHPFHWFYKGPLTSPHITNRQVWHFTMDDNPNLDPQYKEDLINEYRASPVFYRRFVLGEWVVAEGAIYQVFTDNEDDFYQTRWNPDDRKLEIYNAEREEWEQHRIAHINIGVDWGQNKSAHAFVATALTEDFSHLVVLKSIRHKAKGTTPNDVFDWVCEFVEGIEDKYGYVRSIYCDGNEQLLINMLRQNTDLPVRNARKKEINNRIRSTVRLMAQRRLQMLNREDTQSLREFFQTARYKENTQKDERLDDGTYDQDTGDAFEYSFESYMNFLLDEGDTSDEDDY